jgi:hypothetical protein
MTTMRTRGIVRTDISADSAADVEAIRELTNRWRVELEPILVTDSDVGYPLLFALLDSINVAVIVVPDTRHLGSWLPIARTQAEVWTLRPVGRLPRTCS